MTAEDVLFGVADTTGVSDCTIYKLAYLFMYM